MKDEAKHILKGKLEITTFHLASLFLHPNYKGMKMLTQRDRERAIAKVRELICDPIESTANSTPHRKERGARRERRRGDEKLSEFMDSSSDEEEEKDEVTAYTNMKSNRVENESELLKWWRQHQNTFPKLARVATFVHSIPASSAPSERAFSMAGHVLQKRRSSLKSSALDDVLFLNSYFARRA